MNKGSTFEGPIWTLRAEAAASRRLAGSLRDAKSVKDLNSYASALEAEAERLQVERNLTQKPARSSMKSAVAEGRATPMRAMPSKRRAR